MMDDKLKKGLEQVADKAKGMLGGAGGNLASGLGSLTGMLGGSSKPAAGASGLKDQIKQKAPDLLDKAKDLVKKW